MHESEHPAEPPTPPTVEAWALRYIETTSLDLKRDPGPPPLAWQTANEGTAAAALVVRPGRPAALRVQARAERTPRPLALREPRARARLLHTFWHHELQAAELMCWGLLRFAGAEQEFRRGLLEIARDELRHMRMYEQHIGKLGHRVGDFPVRDWFWERVPSVARPVEFAALLGMGLEAANLEHSPRFAEWFRSAGDVAGAELQERIAREEVAHVRFAVRWFERWTGGVDFDAWQAALPKPLSPLLMRGKSLNRALRRRAGMPDAFIDALAGYRPSPRGR